MEQGANIALVVVPGDLDVVRVPTVRRSIDELIAGGCRRVILNMGQVGFIDSSGMGLIISEMRRTRARGVLLSLTNVSPRVMRALSIARIVDLIPVSEAGDASSIPALDPTAMPAWRTTVAVDPCQLSSTRAHVDCLLARMPLTDVERFDLGLAIGEAVGNAVDHACGTVLVSISCYSDRAVVDVTDCGEGFELAEGEVPPVPESCERGRGIALMRLLADSVTISRRPSGSGTQVRIVKLLHG